MKKVAILSIVAVALIVLSVIAFLAAPRYLFNSYLETARKTAGLQTRTAEIPDFKIAYAEGGTGEPVVLLHGFGGNKDNWLFFAAFLTSRYRVIIPDLPGFGDSSRPQDKSYAIEAQADRLDQFVEKLKLGKIHLAGNSMGGAIAGNYAASYPGKVRTLALFDTAGVASPVKSEMILQLERGINPLVIKNTGDFDRLLRLNFVNPPPLNPFMKKYLTDEAIKSAPLNEKIFAESAASDLGGLEARLNKITAPALILWGDSDKVLHISAAEILKKKIRNSELVIIKNSGHLPMLEKPGETAAAYQAFLGNSNRPF